MKGLVIYDSSYGNTKAIGEAITDGLTASGIPAELLYVKDAKHINEGSYDFLVVGSPTKFGTMSMTVKGFLGKVKENAWKNKPFAAYDTENPENIKLCEIEHKNYSAAEKIAARLVEKNMRQLAPALKSAVNDWKGPLLEGEVAKAKEYGAVLADKLKANKN